MSSGGGTSTALLPPVKSVVVYRNGDPFHCGRRFVVNQRQVATMEAFLNDVTQNIQAPLAVRNLYTPRQGTRVRDLTDLQSGAQYVAAGFERFKKLDYLNTGQKKPPAARGEGTQARATQRPNVSAKWRKFIPLPCIIHVFRNGDLLCPPFRFIIPRNMQQGLEQILSLVTERASLRTGAVRRLCSLEGVTLTSAGQLETGHYYVAVGTERFKKLPYVELQVPKASERHFPGRRRLWRKHESRKVGSGPEDRYSDSALLDSPESDGRRVKSTGDEMGDRPAQQVIQRRSGKEQSSIFYARPAKVRKNRGQPRPPPRDGAVQTSVFKGGARRRREELRGAEEVLEDENTAVEIPVDQREAETVEDEELRDRDSPHQGSRRQGMTKTEAMSGGTQHQSGDGDKDKLRDEKMRTQPQVKSPDRPGNPPYRASPPPASCSPHKASTSLERASPPPEEANPFPDKASRPPSERPSPPPGRASPAPGRASPAPGRASPAPGRASPTPGRASPAPGRASPTPGRASPTPERASSTPGRASPTPGRASPTPERASPTPGRASPTPGRASPTPDRPSPPPEDKASPPSERPSPPPVRGGLTSERASPTHDRASPLSARPTPTHDRASPLSARPSPTPDKASPIPKTVTLLPDKPSSPPSDRPRPTPDRLSFTPDRPSPLPERASPTPDRPSPPPERASPTPDRPSPPPERASPTPDRPSPPPERASPTPERASPTPDRPSPPPERASPTPERASPTPDRPSPPPDRPSPKPERATPISERPSPTAESVSLLPDKPRSPTPDRPSFTPEIPSLTPEISSPTPDNESPIPEKVSPLPDKPSSPTPERTSPTPDCREHAVIDRTDSSQRKAEAGKNEGLSDKNLLNTDDRDKPAKSLEQDNSQQQSTVNTSFHEEQKASIETFTEPLEQAELECGPDMASSNSRASSSSRASRDNGAVHGDKGGA